MFKIQEKGNKLYKKILKEIGGLERLFQIEWKMDELKEFLKIFVSTLPFTDPT